MTSRRVEIHPQALDEAAAALAWYEERSSQAPAAFVHEVDEAVQLIFEAPERWPIFEEGCRPFPLRRFPYSIIYRENQTEASKSSRWRTAAGDLDTGISETARLS